jgi:hypothetical protein
MKKHVVHLNKDRVIMTIKKLNLNKIARNSSDSMPIW